MALGADPAAAVELGRVSAALSVAAVRMLGSMAAARRAGIQLATIETTNSRATMRPAGLCFFFFASILFPAFASSRLLTTTRREGPGESPDFFCTTFCPGAWALTTGVLLGLYAIVLRDVSGSGAAG